MLSLNPGRSLRLRRLALVPALTFLFSAAALAQSASAAGRIVGKVTGPAGTAVIGAQVTVAAAAVTVIQTTTDAQGSYRVDGLTPGTYTVAINAAGFDPAHLSLEIKEDATTDGSAKLGAAKEFHVNTEQVAVQEVVNKQQIQSMFLNGRNFLDLAQFEPGVQIQDGENIGPSKAGYSALSLGGRFGRNVRISADGADITDESVGTTAENIPISGIQTFSVEQSVLDVSDDLTSSGAVNVRTQSGTDAYHGELFGLFRDSAIASAQLVNPFNSTTKSFVPTPYQRNGEGGRVGGPIIKDKAFFFVDGERSVQHMTAPVSVSAPYDQYSGAYASPFEQDELQARVDYSLDNGIRLFGRLNYFKNTAVASFFPSSFQIYDNRDLARNAVVGADFDAHQITHSIRFSYLRSQDHLLDATRGSGLPFANSPVSIDIGTFTVGPNSQAPQATVQSDEQIRYDGTKTMRRHIVRFGAGYNHILVGGFASLYSLAPQVSTALGPDKNPLDASLANGVVTVGNGQGYATNSSAFGYPAGGLGPDNRISLYIGDTWKIRPTVTLTPGLRWERDTGRTDSDLPPVESLNSAFPGFGNQVRQANSNFAPQLGFAWDPKGLGKTVIRAGVGLYYENLPYNNVLHDRSLREQTGSFLQFRTACSGGVAQPIPTAASGNISVGIDPTTHQSYCADTIGQAAPALAVFQTTYQADSRFSRTAANPGFIGSQLAGGLNPGIGLLAPNYRSPRALQMNLGFEQEIRRGLVLTADFIRNVETHGLLGIDINHVGAARFFNAVSAQSAVDLAIQDCGAANLTAAIGPGGCPGIHPATSTLPVGSATLNDLAARGLGSALDTGASCYDARDPLTGKPLGYPCAFSGINPNYGQMPILESISRSVYDGLHLKIVQTVANPMRGVEQGNFQISYSFSHFRNPLAFQGVTAPSNPIAANDQDSALQAADNDNPLKWMGPSLLDRSHQISFAGTFDVRYDFHIGIVSHFYSSLSSPAIVGGTGTSGQIFQTDFTGSGVGSQPLPGTSNGSFMRDFVPDGLNAAISRYDATTAGQTTPAGADLVGSGIFTQPQLTAIGATPPALGPAASDQLTFPWVMGLDFRLSWSHTFRENIRVEPSVAVFNVFNLSTFDLPPAAESGWLDEGAGSINSVHRDLQCRPICETGPEANTFRVGNGSGAFSQNSPRTVEFGLRVSF